MYRHSSTVTSSDGCLTLTQTNQPAVMLRRASQLLATAELKMAGSYSRWSTKWHTSRCCNFLIALALLLCGIISHICLCTWQPSSWPLQLC
jgi:hypothetical protein